MTLSLPSLRPKGTKLKLRVSRFAANCWTWTMEFDETDYEEGGSGYFVVLRKGHPLWEGFNQLILSLPGWIEEAVCSAPWYEQIASKHAPEVHRVPVSDMESMVLCRELWLDCTADCVEGD